MSDSYQVIAGIAVVTMNNPPVNGLGYDNRRAIADGFAKGNADPTVKAIVLTGAGKARPSRAAPTSANLTRPRPWPSPIC